MALRFFDELDRHKIGPDLGDDGAAPRTYARHGMPFVAGQQQRVVVKCQYLKHTGSISFKAPNGKRVNGNGNTIMQHHASYISNGAKSSFQSQPLTQIHDRYIAREATELFGAQDVSKWQADPYHYHIIVSPEIGYRLEPAEIQELVSRTFAQLEKRVGVPLEWKAAVHEGTHPHAHVLVRCPEGPVDVQDAIFHATFGREKDQWLRNVACEEATKLFGARLERDARRQWQHQVRARHATNLDRRLEKLAQDYGRVDRERLKGELAQRYDFLTANRVMKRGQFVANHVEFLRSVQLKNDRMKGRE